MTTHHTPTTPMVDTPSMDTPTHTYTRTMEVPMYTPLTLDPHIILMLRFEWGNGHGFYTFMHEQGLPSEPLVELDGTPTQQFIDIHQDIRRPLRSFIAENLMHMRRMNVETNGYYSAMHMTVDEAIGDLYNLLNAVDQMIKQTNNMHLEVHMNTNISPSEESNRLFWDMIEYHIGRNAIIPNTPGEDLPLTNEQAFIERTTTEVNHMYIYETNQTVGKAEDNTPITLPVMVVTNAPRPIELAAYNRFLELAEEYHLVRVQELVKAEFGIDMRIKQIGDTRSIPFLEKVIGLTHEYRLERFKIKTRDDFGNLITIISEDMVPQIHKRIGSTACVRSWSSSTSINMLFVKGVTWDTFDEVFRMNTGNSKKFGKRANEYSRSTELYKFSTEDNLRIMLVDDIREFITWLYEINGIELFDMDKYTDSELERILDGQSVVTQTYARQMALTNRKPKRIETLIKEIDEGELSSGSFRLTCGMGLIKGDTHVVNDNLVKDRYGDYHVVTWSGNVKTEFATDGTWALGTITQNHKHHMPNISAQAGSWSNDLFETPERLKTDYTAYLAEFDKALEQGKAPAHMMRTIDPHNDEDEFMPHMAKQLLDNQVLRFNATGYNLTNSSYLTARVVQGFLTKLEKDIDRLSMPLAWATMAHCTTTSLLLMGGYDLSEYDTTKMFWHEPSGRMHWPDEAAIVNYARHGGFDHDDTFITALRLKVVDANDNPNVTWEINGKTWCIKAVNLRSPNGLTYFGPDEAPGEYSVLDIDLGIKVTECGLINLPTMNFPLYNVYGPIPGLVMSKAPKVTHEQTVEFEEMPKDSYDLPERYSVEDACRMVDMAMANPGVGTIINAMIAFTVMEGTYPEHLPTRLEEMVDCLEQTPSMSGFQLIVDCKEDLIEEMVRSDRKIDHFVAIKRLSKKTRARIGTSRLDKEGKFHLLATHMTTEYHALKAKWIGRDQKFDSGLAVKGRVTIDALMDIAVTDENMKVANSVFYKFGQERNMAPRNERFRDAATGMMKYINDPYIGYARRQFFISLNNEMCDMLRDRDGGTDWVKNVIALYRVVIMHGTQDNVLFQTGDMNSNKGVFDMFLAAMWLTGVSNVHVKYGIDGKVIEG